jgi:hypothetical protein
VILRESLLRRAILFDHGRSKDQSGVPSSLANCSRTNLDVKSLLLNFGLAMHVRQKRIHQRQDLDVTRDLRNDDLFSLRGRKWCEV